MNQLMEAVAKMVISEKNALLQKNYFFPSLMVPRIVNVRRLDSYGEIIMCLRLAIMPFA